MWWREGVVWGFDGLESGGLVSLELGVWRWAGGREGTYGVLRPMGLKVGEHSLWRMSSRSVPNESKNR